MRSESREECSADFRSTWHSACSTARKRGIKRSPISPQIYAFGGHAVTLSKQFNHKHYCQSKRFLMLQLPVDTAWQPRKTSIFINTDVKTSELATIRSYPCLLQTPLRRGGATLQLLQISLPFFIKIRGHFFFRIPHWSKNELAYSNGHVHIHESVVRFM